MNLTVPTKKNNLSVTQRTQKIHEQQIMQSILYHRKVYLNIIAMEYNLVVKLNNKVKLNTKDLLFYRTLL